MKDDVHPWSTATGLECTACGRRYDFGPRLLGCPVCREEGRPGALAVTYDLGRGAAATVRGARSFWAYHQLLPILDKRNAVSLGEGETPLLDLSRIGGPLGLETVFGKLETSNPTHSYKDRTNAVSVSAARQFGFSRICCVSSGNHGVSMAAYAAAAGIEALVLLGVTTPPGVVEEVRAYGARAVIVDPSLGTGSVLDVLEKLHTRHGWFISNRNAPLPAGRLFGNPFGLEGYKTMAFEIWRQLGGHAPDWCLMPTGGGDGIVGLWRGFRDLVTLGLSERAPRMVACQPEAGASLVAAMQSGSEKVEPVTTSATIALSLVDERSADQSLRAVRGSGGAAIAVSDDDLLDALDELGRIGVAVEPSSAAAIATLARMSRAGAIGRDETVVAVLTGTGLRWPASYTRHRRQAERAAPDVDAVLATRA